MKTAELMQSEMKVKEFKDKTNEQDMRISNTFMNSDKTSLTGLIQNSKIAVLNQTTVNDSLELKSINKKIEKKEKTKQIKT